MAVQSTISQIQSAGATAQQQASQKSTTSTLGKDDFLKLLTAQLQQQDPTQPMDNTAFVAQLAQFSTLEQMSNTNDTLTKMLAAQGSALQTTAASMIGKTAVFNTDQVVLEADKPAAITANLSQNAGNVTIAIQNSSGETVRTMQMGPANAGANHYSWDGHDDNGNTLAPGTYTVQVTAADLSGNPISLTQNGSAQITGVTFDSGTTGSISFLAGG